MIRKRALLTQSDLLWTGGSVSFAGNRARGGVSEVAVSRMFELRAVSELFHMSICSGTRFGGGQALLYPPLLSNMSDDQEPVLQTLMVAFEKDVSGDATLTSS